MRLKNSSVSPESAASPEMKAQNFQPKRRWMRRNSQARRRNFLFCAARKVLSNWELGWLEEAGARRIGHPGASGWLDLGGGATSLLVERKSRGRVALNASSMRGTAISAVARSHLVVRMISEGLAEFSRTTAAPSSGGTKSAMNWPKT